MKTITQARVLLVEDHPDFTGLLKMMLESLGVAHVSAAATYEQGLRLFQQEQPDLCLLDIDLGAGKSGIELAEAIRHLGPATPIIYLTAHYTEAQYERSRHTCPSSFLNKELSRLKLLQAIELALQHNPSLPPQARGQGYVPPVMESGQYFFKVGDIYKAIPIEEIAYFYADNKFNYAHTGERNYPTSVQLKTLEEELCPQFVRVHKSYLVNLKFVNAIHPGDSTIEVGGDNLPIGNAYRKAFLGHLRLIR